MTTMYGELTIEDLLTDPLVNAVMQADQVDPSEFEAMLRSAASTIRRTGIRPSTTIAFEKVDTHPLWLVACASARSQHCGAA